MNVRNGGRILIDQLVIHGVERLFMVAGESYLPCIDALNETKDVLEAITCRQESGAAYMAEAHGKLTGTPGICFVTRGPGATNASIGVHTAFQDSTPMILFIGQVGQQFIEREAFQEIDYRRMFGPMAKWVAQIDQTERIPEFISRAFTVATSGRPGPVVLALPEDTLWGEAAVADMPPYLRTATRPAPEDAQSVVDILAKAQQPLMVLGGSGWTDTAVQQMQEFAQRLAVPVMTSWRRFECFDQHHPCAAGQMGWGIDDKLAQRVRDADVIVAIGTRLGEETTDAYQLIESPTPRQKLVHVYPDANEISRVFRPDFGVVADVSSFAAALAHTQVPTSEDAQNALATRQAYVQAVHQEYLQTLQPLPNDSILSLDEVSASVNELLPKGACVTVGAGNYALYPHRYIQFSGGLGSSLAPTVGSMGYGLPAAIAAKLHNPEQAVVCYAGDGCFQMNLQELAVAMQYQLGIVVLVFNNGVWGTICAHQEREFPGRRIALGFQNPDYTQMVKAYGGHGEVVNYTKDFPEAFERALAVAQNEGRLALIELRYEPEHVAPGQTLTQIREQAQKS